MTIDQTDDGRWQAVISRDTTLTDRFVYAVTTTGIYCRPSCPARRPHRAHVRFFDVSTDAETAGYRACQRCQPQAPEDEMTRAMGEISTYIAAHVEADLSLRQLSSRFALSPSHLQRTFKRIVGVSPRQYVEACRHNAMKQALREDVAVTEAIFGAGYRSSSSLYQDVRGKFGMTPSVYRQGGSGMQIAYGIVESPLGQMLVAATPDGVCAVSFGETAEEVQQALHREYPKASIHRDDAAVTPWITKLLAYLAGKQPLTEIPLDIPTSPFRQAVYDALQAIPLGGKRSYGMIARMIGQPTAARAVAQACAHNPVALVIPCHRVVHEDGNPAGYRWGDTRKQRLLRQEQEQSIAPSTIS